MSLEGQLEKLGALYEEKSDGELLGLYEQRDGLTELAQQALTGVMRARRLAMAEGTNPGDAEPGSEPEDSVAEGEVLVYLFHDAFEAREAIRVMREAAIAHRMLDWHVVNPEMAVSQTGVDLGLVVARDDVQRTGAVLKEQLGLFPDAETWDVAPGIADSLAVLSMFERGEALAAARALGEAGMTYLWRDGRDHEGELPDEETVAIEVRAADMERAGQLVEDALNEAGDRG